MPVPSAILNVLLEAAKAWASEGAFFGGLRADFFRLKSGATSPSAPGVPGSDDSKEIEPALLFAASVLFRRFARRASSTARSALAIFCRTCATGFNIDLGKLLDETGVSSWFISE